MNSDQKCICGYSWIGSKCIASNFIQLNWIALNCIAQYYVEINRTEGSNFSFSRLFSLSSPFPFFLILNPNPNAISCTVRDADADANAHFRSECLESNTSNIRRGSARRPSLPSSLPRGVSVLNEWENVWEWVHTYIHTYKLMNHTNES